MDSPFSVLLDAHDDFAEALLEHQEALVRGDLETARDTVSALQADLDQHIRHEEERLLPVLEARGGWGRIGEPRYYREEHARIRVVIADLVESTNALDPVEPSFHRDIALLIGREQSFKALLEHHDERERKGLFPDLERVTSPEEQARLLEPPA